MSKSIFLSKVFWVNAITAILGALEASGVADVIHEDYQGYVIIAIAVLNALLRLVTYRPVTL